MALKNVTAKNPIKSTITDLIKKHTGMRSVTMVSMDTDINVGFGSAFNRGRGELAVGVVAVSIDNGEFLGCFDSVADARKGEKPQSVEGALYRRANTPAIVQAFPSSWNDDGELIIPVGRDAALDALMDEACARFPF